MLLRRHVLLNPDLLDLLRQILAVWDFFLFTWILQFFRKDHRTLHEILSGTALISAPRPERRSR
jgi:uncharacterized RDD family membrane protein YckC